MKKIILLIIVALATVLTACETGEKRCWQMYFRRAVYECELCGKPLRIEEETEFVRCGITENEAAMILIRMGGIPGQTINIPNEEEGTATRQFHLLRRQMLLRAYFFI